MNATRRFTDAEIESTVQEFLTKCKDCKNLTDVQKVRDEIVTLTLENELFPFLRACDAVLSGNSDLVEIVSPENETATRMVIDIFQKNFKFELKPKGLFRSGF